MQLLSKIIFFIYIFQISQVVSAQQEPVQIKISTEKTIIDGKTYYLHTIKPGETLYSISKAYNVPQKEITTINKDIATTLKVGQVLRIPSDQSPKLPANMNSENFIYHIVEASQTVFSIAEKYGITKETIYKHNPETEISPLQTGQVIKIPKDISASKNQVSQLSSTIEHKVKRKETLFSIAKQYKVSVDQIIALNPELNTSDIKIGQVLKIPTGKVTSGENQNAIDENDKVANQKEVITEPCTPGDDKTVHHVAFLLPLYLEENQTISDIDSISGKKGVDDRLVFLRSRNPLEFYEGALIAIDSLKKAGHSFKVHVYDTGRDVQKFSALLSRKEMAEMELFIGPFDTLLIDKALTFAKAHNIKVVSPLSQNNRLLKGNPNLFQVNPPESAKVDAAMKYLETQKDKNIIFYKSNRPADREMIDMFEEKLIGLKSTGFQYKLHAGIKDGTLSSKLSADKENLIIMPSNEETAVAELLRNLNFNNSTSISIFGLPRWTTFSSTDISFFHNLQYEYYTSFFPDYNKPVTKQFILKMRENFKTEPGVSSFSSQGYCYAFLGYDVSFYFLSALAKYGRNFESCLSNYHVDLIQSDFHFKPSESGSGSMNHVVNIIRYGKDYTISKIH